MNSMNYHLSNGIKQFADGTTIHWRIEIYRTIENNADKWMIAYFVNGRGYQYELFAGYGARHQLNYARGMDNAVVSAQMRIDRAIDKIHPPKVWVCPKPTPIPSAIIPYGALYTPVSYAPVPKSPADFTPSERPRTQENQKVQKNLAPVVSADDEYRQRLHNETVELVSVAYKPMGRLVKWDAIGMFDGKQVHFKIFPEHARLFVQAGQAPLPRTGHKDIPNIDVVLEWQEHRSDLRMTGVFSSSGVLHHLDTPLPVAAPTEDTRTDIQKRLGMGSQYAGMFDLKKKRAS